MTKPAVSLDLIQVASPCPAAWESMTGDDRVRFCRQCKLHVYDLSEMSRSQAEQFIQEREGRTCVRFFRRRDGTILTRDCPVGLRAVRQRLVRAVAALAGMLVALATGTLFAGRLKNVGPEIRRPSQAFAEWIEPGSTQAFTVGIMLCPPSLPVFPYPESSDPQYDAPETPLPEPTAEQLQEIEQRLAK